MQGRIETMGKGATFFSLDWNKLVKVPAEKGYYIEAFGSADALIDSELEMLLKSIYSSSESQDLIDEIGYLRGTNGFDGLLIAQILESKTLIKSDLVEKVRKWKKARNIVLHDTYAEYGLVILNPDFSYNNQKELDDLVQKEADKWLKLADDISLELSLSIPKTDEKRRWYFSTEFYEKYPRVKQIKKRFPK
ncbi:MAG: hypothetical protein HYY37_01570 [Candidatus Aenigmarchaeota archaeon]|nr:hypothetical protein [Candidatus Aenigmarchaeota archaeon]